MLEILTRLAEQYADKLAVKSKDQSLTYRQLLEAVLKEADRLQSEEHVKAGMLYQFIASQDVKYLVRFLALHVIGAICVPVDTIQELADYTDTSVSDVLFTTGSTSKPKAVLLSFDAVMADAENLIEAHRYTDKIAFVICGPIHHFGSWSKVFPTLLSGGTLQILEGLKDMDALFTALESSPRTATFLVPSALRMIMQLNEERLVSLAHHIDFIETGAAPFAACDMERLRHLLPYTRLYNTYASTETGVVCTYPFHLPSAEPDNASLAEVEPCVEACAGPTMKHAHVTIDSEGRIVVEGRMIMSGYMHDPEKPTRIVTSDIGEFDAKGRLKIIGRISDFINVGGLKVAPAEVEAAAMKLPLVKECICIPHAHPLMGQVPELLVVCDENEYDRKAIITHLKAALEPYKIPLFYRRVENIQKTYNGKLDRKFYNK